MAIIMVGTFVAGLATTAFADKDFRVTFQLPMNHHLGRNLLVFKQAVDKQTKGKIRIHVYSAATFYKDSEVHDAVASGAIEMGSLPLTQLSKKVPAVDIFSIPYVFYHGAALRKATAPGSPVRGPIDQAILKTGTRVLWWQPFGSVVLLSKQRPVVHPDWIRDKRVRVFSDILGEYIEILGGTAVNIAGSKQYFAYARGLAELGLTGVTSVASHRLYEWMDHMIVSRFANIEFVVLINEKVWQELSQGEREIMNRAARQAEGDLRHGIYKLEAEALDGLRSKINVIEPTTDQIEAWRGTTHVLFKRYVERSGPLGEKLLEAAKPMNR